jgi:hypothetical protein
MAILEILFSISTLYLLVIWGWFIALGFQVSVGWGLAILSLFPISPLVFTYHFRRKVRRSIYYYVASLMLFSATIGYIYLETVDFFPKFAQQLLSILPNFESAESESTPTPTSVATPITASPEIIPTPKPESPAEVTPPAATTNETVAPVTEAPPAPKPHRMYTAVEISQAAVYLQKKVRITTLNAVVYQGQLTHIDEGGILIVKIHRNGGTMIMPFDPAKIKLLEILL